MSPLAFARPAATAAPVPEPRSRAPRRLGPLAVAIAAPLLAAGPAAAGETMRLGALAFEAPDAASGWRSEPVQGGLIFQKQFPPDEDNDRKSAAMIQVLGPVPGSRSGLDAAFERFVGTVEGMAEERPMLESVGVTSNGHRIRADYRCCADVQGLSAGQHTVAIGSDGNQVLLALLGLELRGGAEDGAEAEFAALVRSVRLEPADKPFDLSPAPGDGGLDGVFTRLDTGLRPNAFGGLDFYSDSTITRFDPSGLFSRAIPKGGDIAAHCRETPTDCGLYALKGGGFFGGARRIEMRAVADDFGTIEVEEKPLAVEGEDLSIDGQAYVRVPPLAAGTTFQGTWRYFFAQVGSTAASSASVSGERILELSRDGTFRRSGWAGASGTSETGGGSVGYTVGGDRPGTSGRYSVEGYELTLTGDDGGTERLSLFAPEKGSDELLVIDGANYLKQD